MTDPTTSAAEGTSFAVLCLYVIGLVVFPVLWGLAMDWVFRRAGARFPKSPQAQGTDSDVYHI